MYNKRESGLIAEAAAAEFIQSAGLIVLTRNYRTPYGEVDIIALDRDTLVFIEVKARRASEYGQGREAVNTAKQRKIQNCALYFIQENGYGDKPIRFDVIEIMDSKIDHIKNAF